MNWSSDCSYILLDHQINMAFYRTALIISVKKKSVPALVQSMNNSVDFFFSFIELKYASQKKNWIVLIHLVPFRTANHIRILIFFCSSIQAADLLH